MAGYIRQAAAEIQPDLAILAQSFNKEFNALAGAFAGSGHTHDGSTGNGPRINLRTSVVNTLPVENGGTGVDNIIDARGVFELVPGTDIQAFSQDLKSIADIPDDTSGFLVKTSAGLWNIRSLTGTTNEITVESGSGSGNNPQIKLANKLDLGSREVTGGKFTAGEFSGTLAGNGAGITNINASNITNLNTSLDTKMDKVGGIFSGKVTFSVSPELVIGTHLDIPSEPSQDTHASNKSYVDRGDTAARARANHTGTQPINTISGLQQALDSKYDPSQPLPVSQVVNMNNHRLTNLPNPTSEQDAVNLRFLNLIMPTGVTIPFAGTTLPSTDHWILCDGRAVSRTTYAKLFSVIGIRYGPGNGTSTFNVPDLRERVVAGGGSGASRLSIVGLSGTSIGAAAGSDRHVITEQQLPSHNHGGIRTSVTIPTTGWGTSGGYPGTITSGRMVVGSGDAERKEVLEALKAAGGNRVVQLSGSVSTTSVGGGDPIPTVQPTMIMNYIIKT